MKQFPLGSVPCDPFRFSPATPFQSFARVAFFSTIPHHYPSHSCTDAQWVLCCRYCTSSSPACLPASLATPARSALCSLCSLAVQGSDGQKLDQLLEKISTMKQKRPDKELQRMPSPSRFGPGGFLELASTGRHTGRQAVRHLGGQAEAWASRPEEKFSVATLQPTSERSAATVCRTPRRTVAPHPPSHWTG